MTVAFDAWREEHFSSVDAPEADPSAALSAGDLSNLEKYIWAMDPNQPASEQNMPVMLIDQANPVFTYTGVKDATDIVYEVQTSADLTTFTTLTSGFSKEVLDHGDGSETVSYTFTLGDQEQRFVRVTGSLTVP